MGRISVCLGFFVCLFVSLVPVAEAKVKISEKTTYYPISGRDGEALNASMLAGGKSRIDLTHAVAATETEYNLGKPRLAVKNGKCVVESVDVLLDIKYIFPKWKNANSAPLSVQINWSAFWSELERHEFRHGEIAKKAANKLQSQLDQLIKSNGANCDDFGQLADAKLKSAVRRAAIEQHRFDRVEYMAFSKISRLQANLYQGR